jgi:diguanylate cyclase (GGDEF)-like protein
VVDDSAAVRAALRETLAAMPAVGEIVEAADGVEGLAALARGPVDLILSDLTMPRLDGFKFIAAVRDNPRLRDTMVIMLSARGESVDKVRGLTLGANDYVTKPFERGELQARVGVMLKLRELQEELQLKNAALETANRELERLASLDGLTGLANRRSFFERLGVEFSRARRRGAPVAVLMLDIDHFKRFNDEHGHQAGDEALRTAARVLREGIRAYDVAGRYGGEEFIVLLPDTPPQDALLVAERLRERLALTPVETSPGAAAVMTASFGIAARPATPAETAEELVAAADRALYRAKHAGRNCCLLSD